MPVRYRAKTAVFAAVKSRKDDYTPALGTAIVFKRMEMLPCVGFL